MYLNNAYCWKGRHILLTIVSLMLHSPAWISAQEINIKQDNTDQRKIAGTWRVISVEHNGKPSPVHKEDLYIFSEKVLMIRTSNSPPGQLQYRLDPGKTPKRLDMVLEIEERTQVSPMIYKMSEDKLEICYSPPGEKRPDGLETKLGDLRTLIVMQRVKRSSTEK
jgi:uncharacterized protein (TIGR03067 family)